MSKVIEKLASEGKLSAEQVGRIGRNVAEFVRLYQEDPECVKEAGFGEQFRSAIPQMMTGAAIAATGSALHSIGGAAVSAIRDKLTHARDYKKMMDMNPHLADHDAKEVQKIFSTLHRFNPQYASDPSVAGAFVQETLESARMNIGSLNQIVKARADLAGATRRPGLDLTRFVQPQDPMQAARDQWAEEDRPYQVLRQKLEAHRALEQASPEAYELATGKPKPQAQYEFGKTRT
jgi:hypothetical protein